MMNNAELISPITYSENIELVETLDSGRIIELYNLLNIDVKRFYGNNANVQIYKCLDTGYRFYYPFSLMADGKFYEDLSQNRGNYYSWRWEHGKALEFLKNKDMLLEIGSGFGEFLYRVSKIVSSSQGIEFNSYATQVAREKGLNVEQKLIEECAQESENCFSSDRTCCMLDHL